jgi:hypothetical protein
MRIKLTSHNFITLTAQTAGAASAQQLTSPPPSFEHFKTSTRGIFVTERSSGSYFSEERKPERGSGTFFLALV